MEANRVDAQQPLKIEVGRDGGNRQAGGEPRAIRAVDLNFFYSRAQALYGIGLEIPKRQVTAFIGPSGCGKSTFLRTLNRMNDIIAGTRVEGLVEIDGEN